MNTKQQALNKIKALTKELANEQAQAVNDYNVRAACSWMIIQLNELHRIIQLIEEDTK